MSCSEIAFQNLLQLAVAVRALECGKLLRKELLRKQPQLSDSALPEESALAQTTSVHVDLSRARSTSPFLEEERRCLSSAFERSRTALLEAASLNGKGGTQAF